MLKKISAILGYVLLVLVLIILQALLIVGIMLAIVGISEKTVSMAICGFVFVGLYFLFSVLLVFHIRDIKRKKSKKRL